MGPQLLHCARRLCFEPYMYYLLHVLHAACLSLTLLLCDCLIVVHAGYGYPGYPPNPYGGYGPYAGPTGMDPYAAAGYGAPGYGAPGYGAPGYGAPNPFGPYAGPTGQSMAIVPVGMNPMMMGGAIMPYGMGPFGGMPVAAGGPPGRRCVLWFGGGGLLAPGRGEPDDDEWRGDCALRHGGIRLVACQLQHVCIALTVVHG
jgi:hypothetical protein